MPTITSPIPQMKMEFELIVGEGSIEKMERNWERWCKMMLCMLDDNQLTEAQQWQGVKELDKHVRSPGVSAKAAPLFQLYEVLLF